jgi:deazaflavin-dependent oxidoreductase (nitroreductase family)
MKIKQQIRPRYLRFLKKYFNPLTLRLARSSFGPFTIVRHVGRRSGKRYETPIIVQPVPQGFVIALTYGPQVDWYQNILAAGGCTVVWHKKEVEIGRIEPLDTQAGRSAFPLPERLILGLVRIRHFAKLCVVSFSSER